MLEVREEIKAGLQICNEVLNKGKYVNQEYQLFEQLAFSYLSSDDHHDYPKAIGIYEYMKYLDRSKEEELDKRVRRAEEKFLQKINGCPEKIKSTNQYIDSLKSFRDEISEELTKVDHTSMKEIHLRIRELIINKIIIPLIDDCIEELGDLPRVKDREAKYSIFCTGSIALGTMTPWSDLEFGILLEDGLTQEDYTRVKAYFINLTHLLNMKVLTFGENVLHYQSIKELNDFSTGKGKDNWFADTLTTKGFCFDAALPDGSKTPFGRKDCKGERDYELIGTVEELCKFQEEEEGWHESDPSLVQALTHIKFIYGNKIDNKKYDKKLFNKYLDELRAYESLNKKRSFKILKEDAEKLDPEHQLDIDREGTIFNVKKEIYRFPDRMLVALGDCLGGNGQTTWDIIDDLVEKGKLKATAAKNLKYALNIATELRLRTYSNNKGRKENISTLAQYDSAIKELQDINEVFYLSDLDSLCKYYYVVLGLAEIVKNNKFIERLKDALNQISKIYQDTPKIIGDVYVRLLRLEDAIKEYEKVSDDPFIEGKLVHLYFRLGKIKEANSLYQCSKLEITRFSNHVIAASLNSLGILHLWLEAYEEALQNFEQVLSRAEIEGKPKYIALAYNNKGEALRFLSRYDDALCAHSESLKIRREIYKSDHPDIITSLLSLGVLSNNLWKYDQALKYSEEALQMSKRLYGGIHQTTVSALSYIADIYCDLGQYKKALKYNEAASNIIKILYPSGHPQKANFLNNRGTTINRLGKHSNALDCFNKSFAMNEKFFQRKGMASCYHNMGITYKDMWLANKGDTSLLSKALSYCIDGYKMKKKLFGGQKHSDIASSLITLGYIAECLGDSRGAENKQNEALEMLEGIYGSHHPARASALVNIAKLSSTLGNYDKSLEYYKQALGLREGLFPDKQHPDIALILQNMGAVYCDIKDYNQAFQYVLNAHNMFRKFLPVEHLSVKKSLELMRIIGRHFFFSKDYEKAIEFQEQILHNTNDAVDRYFLYYTYSIAHPMFTRLITDLLVANVGNQPNLYSSVMADNAFLGAAASAPSINSNNYNIATEFRGADHEKGGRHR
ncbi:MAG: hypothetical protein K0R73_686 [Candidatus Midichloriaceae bacterium]|nr:hypothetical protein [Candidatus Midichloriaceae bacterium]